METKENNKINSISAEKKASNRILQLENSVNGLYNKVKALQSKKENDDKEREREREREKKRSLQRKIKIKEGLRYLFLRTYISILYVFRQSLGKKKEGL